MPALLAYVGPDGSRRRVDNRHDSSRCGSSHSVRTRATGPFEGRHSKNGHPISLLLRYVYVATILGWAGRPAPCALRVSNQSGRSYSTVAMEYAKGKISARGREISWLNHPCYLGYKGEVGYKKSYTKSLTNVW